MSGVQLNQIALAKLQTMKLRLHSISIVVLLSISVMLTPLRAQDLLETFDNGFTPSLDWQGDLDAFQANDGRLQLNDTRPAAPGKAVVWLAAPTRNSACWSLDLEMGFSPSASNFGRWWLAADRALTDAAVVGYYIKFGGISGADDAFELLYTDGNTTSLILSGRVGGAADNPVAVSLEICVEDLDWSQTVTYLDGTRDVSTGTATIAIDGVFTGLDLRYTSSRNDAFFFDNLSVDELFVDDTPPSLVLAKALSATIVLLEVSEALSSSSVRPDNFSVGGTSVASVTISGKELTLNLDTPLLDGVPTAIEIQNLSDPTGNQSGVLTSSVTYVAPFELPKFGLLISEIMADPTPEVGLPGFEYVELFNDTQLPISLADISLEYSNGRIASLPDITLAPATYIALTSVTTADARYTLAPDLPALTNGGMTLTLRSATAAILDRVTYNVDWHLSSKDDGGYSLERTDLSQACLVGGVNWTSSSALAGGTPGASNTASTQVNLDSLRIESIDLAAPDSLLLQLNVELNELPTELIEATNFSVSETKSGTREGQYILLLESPLLQGDVYSFRLSPNLSSCLRSNVISARSYSTGVPEAAQPGDWELNEIMYDPASGDGRYIELVNVSDKLLSSDELVLARLDAAGNVEDLVEPESDILVPPGGFVVYAANAPRLRARYPQLDPTAVSAADLPTLADEDCLQLFDAVQEEIYFTVCYTEDWHNNAYANTKGVSLERIQLSLPATRATNWTSAASTANFGTPTRRNSQSRDAITSVPGNFSLASERLSPDGDGFEDLLVLNYSFDAPGTLARFEIFDVQGRAVLSANTDEAPGNTGIWTWDGTNDDGELAVVGTYVVRVTYWNTDAPRKTEYLPFSLMLRR